MKSLRRCVCVALLLAAFSHLTPVPAQEPPPAAQPSATPTRAELETKFNEANAQRGAAPANTKERSDAAKAAMQLASPIGWLVFDQGNYEEAGDWFAKSGELKKDGLESARGYWENDLKTAVLQNETAVAARIRESEVQLAREKDPEKKKELRDMIDMRESMRHMLRYNAASELQTIARDARDFGNQVKYCEMELKIRRAELAHLERSRAPQQKIDLKKVEVATALRRVGEAQAELALFEAAEKNMREALSVRRALPATLAERRLDEALSAFAFMYLFKIGDLVKAKEFYEQALTEMQATAALREQARAADALDPAMKAMLTPEMLAAYEERIALTRDGTLLTDTLAEFTILTNLGSIAHESGDFAAALSFYDRAAKLADGLPQGGYLNLFENGRVHMRARIFGALADLHIESGELQRALEELEQAIQLNRQIGDLEPSANCLTQAARLLFEQGDLEKARPYVEQARKIFASAQRLPGVVSSTSFLALLARDAGQIEDAARFAEEALQLAVKTGNFGAQGATARTFASIRLKQSKLPEATALLAQATAADARTNSIFDRIATRGVSGEVLEAEGKNEEALERYREGIKLLEAVRATAASESAFANMRQNARAYERIVLLLIKMGRLEEAFDYLNRAKCQKLRDQISLNTIKSKDKPVQELIDRAADLDRKLQTTNEELSAEVARPEVERDNAKVANLKERVASAEAELRSVFADINRRNPNWGSFMTLNPKTVRQAQSSIPNGVTFLQYAPLGDQLYIFVVTRETLKLVTPPTKLDELWKRVKAVRRQITTGESGAPVEKNLVALYDMLIAPVEAELASTKTIGFIPNQLLFYLPMQALAKLQPDGGVRYLIQDKQLVYLAEADVMKAARAPAKRSRTGMMAVGNPTGAELPASEAEARAISALVPGTEVLAGSDATKGAVNQRWAANRVVHLATHGRLNSVRAGQELHPARGRRCSGPGTAHGWRSLGVAAQAGRSRHIVRLRNCSGRERTRWERDYHPGFGFLERRRCLCRGQPLECRRREHEGIHGRVL
jgi:tetratricopeptide (TPR) repeat protein